MTLTNNPKTCSSEMLKNPAKTLVPQVWYFWFVKLKTRFPMCCSSSWQVNISTSPQPWNGHKLICCTVSVLLEGRTAKCFLAITDLLPLTSKTRHSIHPTVWLKPQHLSSDMKGDFQAAWCCQALSPSQAVQSASLLSLVSQNALSRDVRGSLLEG